MMFSNAQVRGEEDIPQIEIRGRIDCSTIYSVSCGNLDFFFRELNGDPHYMGGGMGGGGWAQMKPKPPSVNNSNKDRCADSTKNPVYIPSGEKLKEELDFQSRGKYGLTLARTYRSMNAIGTLFGPSTTVIERLSPLLHRGRRQTCASIITKIRGPSC